MIKINRRTEYQNSMIFFMQNWVFIAIDLEIEAMFVVSGLVRLLDFCVITELR